MFGNPIRMGGLLTSLTPSSACYTAVLEPPTDNNVYYSQVLHKSGSRSARFSFVTPDCNQKCEDLYSLVDFLSFQAGEMGALNVLAQIEESHPFFEILRRAGFSVYSWESIWRVPETPSSSAQEPAWTSPEPGDENAIRCLYQTLVPPLVQHAEPYASESFPRLVYRKQGDILAYVDILSGSAGTCLMPLVHPSVENVSAIFPGLINMLRQKKKPVYLQVRSYQAWLSDALETAAAVPSPRFALLVKHLALGKRYPSSEGVRVRGEQRQAEPTATIVNQFQDPGSQAEGIK